MKRLPWQRLLLLLPLPVLMLAGCEESPTAGFFASEVVVRTGEEVYFTNNSCCACRYEWDFGDGTRSETVHPVHSWDVPGIYTVTLTAWSRHGHADRALMDITVLQPTTLHVEVKEIESDTLLAGARVTLYATLDDWNNERHPVAEGTTGEEGTIDFVNLDTRRYYVDVWGKDYNNYNLAARDIRYIETPLLKAGEVNLFTAWVEYTSPSSTLPGTNAGKTQK